MKHAILIGVVAVGVASTACRATTEEGSGAGSDALTSATPTKDRPAIGLYETGDGHICTATLIARSARSAGRVAITAAHCVSYQTVETPGKRGSLKLETVTGPVVVGVDKVRSYGSGPGADDIALLHLDAAVPVGTVAPMQLYMNEPSEGDAVELYGYGCTSRSAVLSDGIKRFVSYRYGSPTTFGCSGDSGGPLLDRRFDDAIFGIHSAHASDAEGGRDVTAAVWTRYSELFRDMESW